VTVVDAAVERVEGGVTVVRTNVRPTWEELMELLLGREVHERTTWPSIRLRITPGAAIQVWTLDPERGGKSQVASVLLDRPVHGNAVVLRGVAVASVGVLRAGDDARGELTIGGPVWRHLTRSRVLS
jgi:hypothetical protein